MVFNVLLEIYVCFYLQNKNKENFTSKRPKPSSPFIMNKFTIIPIRNMDSINFDSLDNEGDCLLKNRKLSSPGDLNSRLSGLVPLSIGDKG